MSDFMVATFVFGIVSTTKALPMLNVKVNPSGSEVALQGEIPFQISIRYGSDHICGGALIELSEKQVVLTAAHCVDSGSVSFYRVVAGDLRRSDTSGKEQIRKVTKIVVHEYYNGLTFANDIALLAIQNHFDINDHVQPIDLPAKGQQTSGDIIVSGWGSRVGDDGLMADVLQKIQIPVVPDEICQEQYEDETILPSMLCAGLLGQGGKDSCQGDSGWPLRAVVGNYLAGIVSWGYGCAAANFPGVNTEISHFIEWIEDQVNYI